jgi:hypothetical protein
MIIRTIEGTPQELVEYEEILAHQETEEEIEAQFLTPLEREEMLLEYLRLNGRKSTQEMNKHFNWGKYFTNYALRGGDCGQTRGLESKGLVKRVGWYYWEAVG